MTTAVRLLLLASSLALVFSACTQGNETQHQKGTGQSKRVEPQGKVTNYSFLDTVCKCGVMESCGVHLWQCADGKEYICFHNVVTVDMLVDKTDNNDGSCKNEN